MMAANLHFVRKDQREDRSTHLIEVTSREKQLVMLIHTKGLLSEDVRELYRKVRSGYEEILVNGNNSDPSELQDTEYFLWKLHYKHIDEFRKWRKNGSASESKKSRSGERDSANHLDGFKLFLSDASDFYRNLIVNIRRRSGFPDKTKRTRMCQFLCHRFLVCLGDIARYREQYEKPDVQNHSWSMAATHYMEATAIWPDSGNPQNQLAVLATYVNDEFLALYHCIRSLAVKEPFPDAHDNLIVLLERNRPSVSPSPSSETHFNYLKPSERCIPKTGSNSSDDFSFGNGLKAKQSCSAETDLWSLFIKLISFFYIKSSFDDFPFAFASVMRELDVLMALDDQELKASLESYRNMDSVRMGPHRALQVVSVLLYTLQNLINGPKPKGLEDRNGMLVISHKRWALLSTFVFMGRFVDRCWRASRTISCPLLPAVLVFVEWLPNKLNEGDEHWVDEKCRLSMSYFFGSFVDLLKKIGADKRISDPLDANPLWEDYELRGFTPVSCSQESLDMLSHFECVDSFEKGTESRTHRLIAAGRILYDRSRGKLFSQYVAEFDKLKETENDQKRSSKERPKAEGEDEEVILFSPTKIHSVPVCEQNRKAIEEIPRDYFNNHTQSLLKAQIPEQGRDFSTGLFKTPAAQPVSAGPPSLSGWVIEEKKPSSVPRNIKHVLAPIEEAPSESLSSLLAVANPGSSPTDRDTSSPYAAPAPSAPLLPDNAGWYRRAAEAEKLISHASPAPAQAPTSYTAGPALVHLTTHRQMTSSEWLRHYLQAHQSVPADRSGGDQAWPWPWPPYYYANPVAPGATVQVETPPLCTVTPLDYGAGRLLYGYPRPGPFVCGAGTEEPQPLLQYLKERERQLRDPAGPTAYMGLGPTYMGN